jgi:hypothetical protein
LHIFWAQTSGTQSKISFFLANHFSLHYILFIYRELISSW